MGIPPISTQATFRRPVIVITKDSMLRKSRVTLFGGFGVSERAGGPRRNGRAALPAHATEKPATEWPRISVAVRPSGAPDAPAALREGTADRKQTWNRRATGSRWGYKERRSDVKRN